MLDAVGCDVPADGVHVDYVDDAGVLLERIDARYDGAARAVSAPISHFSVYAIGL